MGTLHVIDYQESRETTSCASAVALYSTQRSTKRTILESFKNQVDLNHVIWPCISYITN